MTTAQLHALFLKNPVVTTDSRQCPEGSIFFALKGESFNGNAFASKALEQGCSYAVIDEAAYAVPGDERMILVDDVLRCLQDLASYHRDHLGTFIVGITGTNGKTTTKELVSAVLQKGHRVLFTQGNFNNHIGVPLTLLRLTPEHDMAVIEMGANHPGEIQTLVNIVHPNCGLITNVGKAHLEGFGSLEGVIRTKGELYDYLREHHGFIFLHHDNTHLRAIAQGLEQIPYGSPSDEHLRVEGEVTVCDPFLNFRWREQGGEWHEVHTHLIGSYNLDNALAAITVGLRFGITPAAATEALEAYVPSNNRSMLKETPHNHLIVDAYNANPTSMMAALRNFRDMQVSPKMAILGDMRELGEGSLEEHQKIVDFLSEAHLDRVWLVGAQFAATRHTQRCFAHVDEVKAAIQTEMPEGYYLLIKGSNGMKLAQLAEIL